MMVFSLDRLCPAHIQNSLQQTIMYPRKHSLTAGTRIMNFPKMGTFRDKNSLLSGTVNFTRLQAEMTKICEPKIIQGGRLSADVKAA